MNPKTYTYEDINDAIIKAVNGNPKGLSIKQIASYLWPSRNPDTARSALSRAINPENTDIHLSPEEIVRIMEIAGRPEDVIFFLCDRFGYERPLKKNKGTFEAEVKAELNDLMDGIRTISMKVEQMGRFKKEE